MLKHDDAQFKEKVTFSSSIFDFFRRKVTWRKVKHLLACFGLSETRVVFLYQQIDDLLEE